MQRPLLRGSLGPPGATLPSSRCVYLLLLQARPSQGSPIRAVSSNSALTLTTGAKRHACMHTCMHACMPACANIHSRAGTGPDLCPHGAMQPGLVRSLEQVRANIGSKEAAVVDARGAGRFAGAEAEPRPGVRAGHIPGSLNVPFTQVQQGSASFSRVLWSLQCSLCCRLVLAADVSHRSSSGLHKVCCFG